MWWTASVPSLRCQLGDSLMSTTPHKCRRTVQQLFIIVFSRGRRGGAARCAHARHSHDRTWQRARQQCSSCVKAEEMVGPSTSRLADYHGDGRILYSTLHGYSILV